MFRDEPHGRASYHGMAILLLSGVRLLGREYRSIIESLRSQSWASEQVTERGLSQLGFLIYKLEPS
jgi:hypothetical protein